MRSQGAREDFNMLTAFLFDKNLIGFFRLMQGLLNIEEGGGGRDTGRGRNKRRVEYQCTESLGRSPLASGGHDSQGGPGSHPPDDVHQGRRY